MIGFSSRTTDDDKGAEAVKKVIEEIKRKPYVEIGILEGDGNNEKRSSKPAKGKMPTLLEVATANEFGTATIPERSFIRATVNANEQRYFNTLGYLKAKILKKEMSITAALGLLGQKIQADIINRINSGIAPANSPETIERKGSSKPLIDTGQLKQSIRYVVVSKE